MKPKIIIILICCFSLFATTVYAHSPVNCLPSDSVLFYGYEEEGAFVQAPALLGGCVGMLTGGIVALPFALVGGLFDNFEKTYTKIGFDIVPQSCSFITGLPFYLTKKIVYDLPKSVFVPKAVIEPNSPSAR